LNSLDHFTVTHYTQVGSAEVHYNITY